MMTSMGRMTMMRVGNIQYDSMNIARNTASVTTKLAFSAEAKREKPPDPRRFYQKKRYSWSASLLALWGAWEGVGFLARNPDYFKHRDKVPNVPAIVVTTNKERQLGYRDGKQFTVFKPGQMLAFRDTRSVLIDVPQDHGSKGKQALVVLEIPENAKVDFESRPGHGVTAYSKNTPESERWKRVYDFNYRTPEDDLEVRHVLPRMAEPKKDVSVKVAPQVKPAGASKSKKKP